MIHRRIARAYLLARGDNVALGMRHKIGVQPAALSRRARQKAYRDGGADDDDGYDDPESGLFIVQNGLDARLDARLAEGEGTRRDRRAPHAAVEQRL